MSLGAELKRRLEVEDQPLAKRLCLAENLLSSPFFPASNREEIILNWIFQNLERENGENRRSSLSSLKNCLGRAINFKNFNTAFKTKIFNVLYNLIQKTNDYGDEENILILESCLNFLENHTLSSYLQQCIQEYFAFQTKLLENILHNYRVSHCPSKIQSTPNKYESLAKRGLNDISNFTKNFGKKAVLAECFVDCKTLNVILQFSNEPKFNFKSLNICQSILFPKPSLQVYRNYLSVLITGGSVSSLIEEKGEAMRSIVKVSDVLFKYQGENDSDSETIVNFIKLFIYCCKSEEMLIFFFTVILAHCLGVHQDYIDVKGNVPKLEFDKDTVKKIYLKLIVFLTEYNVNLNAKFLSESKNDDKYCFIVFLQTMTLMILNGSPLNADSLNIVKSVIELDPLIIEPIMANVVPDICLQKKKTSLNEGSANLHSLYTKVMIALLNIQFKLSRGTEFLPKVLPSLKSRMESMDHDQQKYILKERKLLEEEGDAVKVSNKIILCEDVFPASFCDRFGKLGSELMSWQNINLFKVLKSNLNEFCISMLNGNDTVPSVILLTEILCSLLGSFLEHSKMADQGIPQNIFNKFTEQLEHFEMKVLLQFGRAMAQCTEKRLLYSFLHLCYSFGQLKVLLLHYQPHYTNPLVKMERSDEDRKESERIYDLSVLHPYLSDNQWKAIFKSVKKIADSKCWEISNLLILQRLTILNSNSNSLYSEYVRKYAFENLDNLWNILVSNQYNSHIIFTNLSPAESKFAAAKIVMKIFQDNPKTKEEEDNYKILKYENIANNRNLLSMICLECARCLWALFEKSKSMKKYTSIYDASESVDFDIKSFADKNINNFNEYMKEASDYNIFKKHSTIEKVLQVVDLLNQVPIEYLKENIQHVVLFSIFIIKMSMKKYYSKNLMIILDEVESKTESIFLKIFELSYKAPNILEIFPMELLFESDIFELTNSSMGKFNSHFKILKQLFQRLITKEHVKYFERLVPYLNGAIGGASAENSQERLKNKHFQVATVLYMTLVNYKKVNLPSEVKAPVTKAVQDVKEIICNVFNEVKWKSLAKNNDESIVDASSDNINMDSSIRSNIEDVSVVDTTKLNDFDVVLLNVVESYAHIIQTKCDCKNDLDSKLIKHLGKGLKMFSSLSLSQLSSSKVTFHHARGCNYFFNVILKNEGHFDGNRLLQDKNSFHADLFDATAAFVQNAPARSGYCWTEVSNISLENWALVFEKCDQTLFVKLLKKYCFSDFKAEERSPQKGAESYKHSPHLIRSLWSCFLNVNLTSLRVKHDARLNLLKQICLSFYVWLRGLNVDSLGDDVRKIGQKSSDEEDEGFVDGKEVVERRTMKENVNKMAVYFEILTEFISIKKMTLSVSTVDMILEMPSLVTFDTETSHCYGDANALDIFSQTFECTVGLINALLLHRSEMLQDRWPCFLQIYRKVLKELCTRSNADKVTDSEEVERLIKLAISIERLTQSMVKTEKHDLSRIASYLIADIVHNFHRTPVLTGVKFHVEKCVYWLLNLLDSHSVGFLMRNMQDSHRILFQQINKNYNKYYKYTGTS